MAVKLEEENELLLKEKVLQLFIDLHVDCFISILLNWYFSAIYFLVMKVFIC